MPIDGEAATGDVDVRVLSQGDILHQGQGGAGSFLGFRYGCVKGIEIGNALPCRHGSHGGIAAAAFAGRSVHTVLGMGDDVDGAARLGGGYCFVINFAEVNDGIDIHQFIVPIAIGEGNVSGQEVAQGDGRARISVRADQRTLPGTGLEHAAGDRKGRSSMCFVYLDTGVIGAAGDGHACTAVNIYRLIILVGIPDAASILPGAVHQGDFPIGPRNHHHIRGRTHQCMAVQIQGQIIALLTGGARGTTKQVAADIHIPQELQSGAGIAGSIAVSFQEVGIECILAIGGQLYHVCHAAGAHAGCAKIMRMREHVEGCIREIKGVAIVCALDNVLALCVVEVRIAGSQQRGQAAGSLGRCIDSIECTAGEPDGSALDYQGIATPPGNAEFTSLDVQGAAGDEKGVALDFIRCAFHRAAAGDGQIRAAANLQRIVAIAHTFLGNAAAGQIQGDGLADLQLPVCDGCSQNRQGHGRLGNPIQCIKGIYYAVIVSDSLASGDAGENLTLADCAVCMGSISSHRGMLTVIAAVGTYATIEVMGAARSDSDIGNGGILIDVSSF